MTPKEQPQPTAEELAADDLYLALTEWDDSLGMDSADIEAYGQANKSVRER